MIARPGAPFRSANAGEISDDAAGRIDIKQFYSAGLRYRNIEPVPLSGYRRMAGSVDIGPVRGQVAAVGGLTVVAVTTVVTGLTDILHITGITGTVCGLDLSQAVVSSGAYQMWVEALVGGAWQAFGTSILIGTDAEGVTFAVPPGAGVAATALRVMVQPTAAVSYTLGTPTVLTEGDTQIAPRYVGLAHDSGDRYFASLGANFLDIYEDDDFVAGLYLPTVSPAIQPDISFYAENGTIGIAHRDLRTLRVVRTGAANHWQRTNWPFDGIPAVDLGGSYAKVDDIWSVTVNFTNSPFVGVVFTVNGEATPSTKFCNAAGTPIKIDDPTMSMTVTAAHFKAALEALPSLGPTVTVTFDPAFVGNSIGFTITFGGDLSGKEYQFVPEVVSTADAAALGAHTQIGKTVFEPLFSVNRGWPGGFGLVQDRMVYLDIKAVPPALATSAAGEYFNIDIKASGAAAARLDKVRGGQVSERVLAVAEGPYPLIFTDRSVYFASNRTIDATQPVNLVQISALGTVAQCPPCLMETKVYYIGANPEVLPAMGHQVLSLSYSEIETTFEAVPESLLAEHLVAGVIRSAPQRATIKSEASKLWLLRNDGRLVVACVIRSQDVLGFCEWVPMGGGAVQELAVDARNNVRVAVLTGGLMRHERLTRTSLFHGTVTRTPDLSGRIIGLKQFNGMSVWVKGDGYVQGPFPVASGYCDTSQAYTSPVQVGVWQTPLWKSMPRVLITRNDEVVRRPGRIHTAQVAVIDTTSLAIGANDQPFEDVPLGDTTDPVSLPRPPKSGTFTRAGMLGRATGTTLVIAQTQPGELHVRDIILGESL